MKKINIIICSAIFTGMTLMTACDDFLTQIPPSDSSYEGFWTRESDAKSWMAGTYYGIQNTLARGIFWWGDARSDSYYNTQYGDRSLQRNALDSNQDYADWTNLYAVVNRCNIGIESVPKVPELSDAAKSSYIGQFEGLRALMYFYAIRVWGEVPLMTSSWNGDPSTKLNPRNSISDICTQIESDIEGAIKKLDNQGVYYFNKGAALALKMDYLMWFKRYEEAEKVSQTLLDLKRYDYVTDGHKWRNIFLTPAATEMKETIFTMHWDYARNGENPYGGSIGAGKNNASYHLSDALLQKMIINKNDVRFWGVVDTLSLYDKTGKITITPGQTHIIMNSQDALCNKICKYYKIATVSPAITFESNPEIGCDFSLPIYRFADVMLLRAEALNKMNKGQEALDIVNKIRSRCGNNIVATLEDFPLRDGFVDGSREKLILDERQIEFYCEGRRWFDLRRTGYVREAMDYHLMMVQYAAGLPVVGFGTDDGRLLFPIHSSSLTSNSLINQNTPY